MAAICDSDDPFGRMRCTNDGIFYRPLYGHMFNLHRDDVATFASADGRVRSFGWKGGATGWSAERTPSLLKSGASHIVKTTTGWVKIQTNIIICLAWYHHPDHESCHHHSPCTTLKALRGHLKNYVPQVDDSGNVSGWAASVSGRRQTSANREAPPTPSEVDVMSSKVKMKTKFNVIELEGAQLWINGRLARGVRVADGSRWVWLPGEGPREIGKLVCSMFNMHPPRKHHPGMIPRIVYLNSESATPNNMQYVLHPRPSPPPRVQQVLMAYADGKTPTQCAEDMQIAYRTLLSYVDIASTFYNPPSELVDWVIADLDSVTEDSIIIQKLRQGRLKLHSLCKNDKKKELGV